MRRQFSESLVILPLCMRRTGLAKFEDGMVWSCRGLSGAGGLDHLGLQRRKERVFLQHAVHAGHETPSNPRRRRSWGSSTSFEGFSRPIKRALRKLFRPARPAHGAAILDLLQGVPRAQLPWLQWQGQRALGRLRGPAPRAALLGLPGPWRAWAAPEGPRELQLYTNEIFF